MRSGGLSLRRCAALIRKEALEILRDPSSIAIAVVLPILLLVLFGYAVSLDPQRIRTAVVAPVLDRPTMSLIEHLRGSPYFAIEVHRSRQPAEERLRARGVEAVLVFPDDFAARLARGELALQLLLDGVNANTARIVQAYLRGTLGIWAAGELRLRLEAPALLLEPRLWFNTDVESRRFLVPGLVAVIMTLIGSLLTALVVAREWEHGSFESLFATPIRITEILAGKLLPYFLLGMIGMALVAATAVFLFGVPLRGSLAALAGMSALYLVVTLEFGLLVSGAARNQFVAGQITLFAAFLPAFILSGFVFDIRSMPGWMQTLTYIVPARYFVSSLQTLFLAGDLGAVLFPDAAALAAFAFGLALLIRTRTRKSLE